LGRRGRPQQERELRPSDVVIIREIYDGENAQEIFEQELDKALEANCRAVIIEPSRLGDNTARWIATGNCLHKTAVLGGIGAVIFGTIWPDRPYLFLPLGVLSISCTTIYTLSWQGDPCRHYQVETNPVELASLPLARLTTSSPVVLVRKEDRRRIMLHSTVSLCAFIYCAWRFSEVWH